DAGLLGAEAGGPVRVNGAQGNLVAEIRTAPGARTDANVRLIMSDSTNKSTGTSWAVPQVRTVQPAGGGAFNIMYDTGDTFNYSAPGAGGYCTPTAPAQNALQQQGDGTFKEFQSNGVVCKYDNINRSQYFDVPGAGRYSLVYAGGGGSPLV